VHDLSSKLGKQVELKMSGESTELDKTVMERIVDPLVHLVRNTCDHGIEMPDARRAAGKPETGTLTLSACHKGGNVVIEIADDGAGLNQEKILKKARERGLVKPDQQLTADEIHDLIFLPGFSTAEQVSDVSGRGVGMDVVRKNIQGLGGNVEIFSVPGKGARFTVRLPLTLAIMDGQSVAVGKEYYIVPLVSIIVSTIVRNEHVSTMANGGEVFKFRDEYLPLMRLYDLYGATPRTTDISQGLMVVVEGDGRRAGLFVDELLGQQQVVIKSLEANYKRVEGISGATILGDGSVALILDIPGLIRIAHQKKGRLTAPALSFEESMPAQN
jgi:two-component system chemotaxis sensor kinase CheA